MPNTTAGNEQSKFFNHISLFSAYLGILPSLFFSYLLLRGTKDFRISVSNDTLQWQAIVEAILPDARGLGCDVPTLDYDMGINTHGRFLELNLISYYTEGPGLQYVHIKHASWYGSMV